MKNYDTAKFTQFELNIIELFERLQSATVTAEENGIYYTDDGYENGYTKSALLEHCINGINHWYSETDTEDMLNNDFVLESNLDYLQLLLSAPSDTTVLAVGQGCVSAPSTTTAYLRRDYHGNELLAVYDYEANEAETKRDLCELFPLTPPQFEICFRYENSDYDYMLTVGAEDRTEAITKAIEIFKRECDWYYKPYKSIEIEELEQKPETETKEAKAEPLTVLDLLKITNCDTNIVLYHLDAQNIGYECRADEIPTECYNYHICEIYADNDNLNVCVY